MLDDFLSGIVQRKPKVSPPAPSVRERRSAPPAPLPPSNAVHATYDPDRKGRITVAGPEVSEVLWEDGARRFIANNFLMETT